MADPVKRAAYIKDVEKARKQLAREYLRKWKAAGGLVLNGSPAVSAEPNFTLSELALWTSLPKTFWLRSLKQGAIQSFRMSEISAYFESRKVPAKTAA